MPRCLILHFHQQWISTRVPVVLQPYRYLVVSLFQILAIVTGVLVAHCSFNLHFPVTYDVRHVFISLFAIFISLVSFSTLCLIIAVGFFCRFFFFLSSWGNPHLFSSSLSFCHEWMLNFIKCFFRIYWYDHVGFLP